MRKEEDLKTSNDNLLKFLKENITLILLALYSISFINYYFFYNFFNIPIFNYIGLNDLLFYSIEYIFSIILTVFIVEVVLFIVFAILYGIHMNIVLLLVKKKYKLVIEGWLSKRIRERTRRIFDDKFSDSLFDFKMTLFVFSLFGVLFFPLKTITIPALFIYMIFLLDRREENRISNLSLVSALVIVVISLGIITSMSIYQKRYHKQQYEISFEQNGKWITTNQKKSKLNYLGETSTNIFLYDIDRKETRIYFKDNIEDIIVKSNSSMDEYLRDFFESSLYREIKKFLEM